MVKNVFLIAIWGLALLSLSAAAYDIEPPQPTHLAVPTITPTLRTVDILNYFEGRWAFESFFLNSFSKTVVKSEEIYRKTGMDTLEMQPVWAQAATQHASGKKSRTLRFTGLGGLISIDMGDTNGPQPVTIEGNVYSFKPTSNGVMRMTVLGKNRFIFEHEERDNQGNITSKQISAYERVLR